MQQSSAGTVKYGMTLLHKPCDIHTSSVRTQTPATYHTLVPIKNADWRYPGFVRSCESLVGQWDEYRHQDSIVESLHVPHVVHFPVIHDTYN
jgi:hypothetical protein